MFLGVHFQGTKVSWPFHSGERMGQGAKGPGCELARVLVADSLVGANWPGSKKAMCTHRAPVKCGCADLRSGKMVNNNNNCGSYG